MSKKTRREKDSLGFVSVLNNRYWGAQTQRAIKHFNIGSEEMPFDYIRMLATIKKSAAMANHQLKQLSDKKAKYIIQVSNEVIQGKLNDHFPLQIWQSGSGTQTNMNVNEVIAYRANRHARQKKWIHPNDDVNKGQSTNDVFSAMMQMVAYEAVTQKLLPALMNMKKSLARKQKQFDRYLKVGRTHLQDAVPISLGQEFSGYVAQIDANITRIKRLLPDLLALPIGGTAVGTGVNAHPQFAKEVIHHLKKLTKTPYKIAFNRFSLIAAHDDLIFLSGALKTLAASLYKISNDIRWMSSGPHCGLNELMLSANEPGSSIMPGKINPTQCEMLQMVCAQVMGNDVTINFAGAQGDFELNANKPVIIYNLLQSIKLLTGACESFSKYCVVELKVNKKTLEKYCRSNLMIATFLVPYIGYEKAAKIVQYAYKNGISVKKACLKLKILNETEFQKIVK